MVAWPGLADKILVLIPYKPENQRIPRGREAQGRLEAASGKAPEMRRGCSARDLCCGEGGDVFHGGMETQRQIHGKALERAAQGGTLPGSAPGTCACGTWGVVQWYWVDTWACES